MRLSILSWVAGVPGFVLLVYGVSMFSDPAACIVAGAGLMGWSFLADRASAALRAKSKPQGG
jgi:uncharacterized membrane protein HdeD (DUF308 family)